MPHAAALIVDGMNVIGARPDGWWRDRDAAAVRLLERLVPLATDETTVTLVLDGRPAADLPEGCHGDVAVVYATRSGPDAADDRIVDLVGGAAVPSAVEVISSDRDLRARVRVLGAQVRGAGAFLADLDAGERSRLPDG